MPTAATTIPALLDAQASAHGARTAVAAAGGHSFTYARLAATIDRLVARLDAHAIDHSSRLAVVLPNGLDVAVGLLAASSAAIAVPLAPTATADEYRVWFKAGRVSHLLTSLQAAPEAREVAAEFGLPVIELARHDDGYRLAPENPPAPRRAWPRLARATDVAVVLMTSGSTGTPKRVPLTHANLLAGASSVAGALDLGTADRVLVMWEQYHVGGIVDLLLAPLVSGGTAVCAGSFDAARFFALIDDVRPTWFQGVPTTLRELMVHARLAGRLPIASTLRCLRSVAAPLSPGLMHELEAAFGVPVIQTFGMTEAAPLITTNRLPPGLRKPGSTGTAYGCEVAVLDAAGEALPADTIGEVAIRGPNVFAGYEDDPETNTRVFRRGWFLTGDVGRLDTDGFLSLTGRVKELINRGGEKVAPAEVEEAAARHPAVAEAAAFAVPHATLGEDIGLALVARGDEAIDRDELRAHLARHLSRFKVPAVILCLDELPRCPIGKIRRRDLAARASLQAVATSEPAATARAPFPPADVAALAEVWALHLDLPAVDPDADFQILGGDSLARIRLVVAVESLAGVSFPDDIAATITTVRRMAADIRRLGGRITAGASNGAGNTAAAPPDLWGDVTGPALVAASPAEIRRRLAASRSVREFEAVRETLLNALTRHELSALARRPFGGRITDWIGERIGRMPIGIGGTERAQTVAARAAWRNELLTMAASGPEEPRWRRTTLAPTATLYERQPGMSQARRLVIGFAGNHQRLMLPIHAILDHLPPHDDLLLVADPDRRHFAAGVRGIAATFAGLCTWLGDRVADRCYDTTVTFGTSAGGLPAICAAYALGCSRAAAVGADAPASHPPLSNFLREQIVAADAGQPPVVMLAFDSANHRDQAGGAALAASVPSIRTRIIDASGRHNILLPALMAGRLAELLLELLGTPTESSHDDRIAA